MPVPKAITRDDFPAAVKRRLADRAGNKCSNPGCLAPTSGPQLQEDQSVNVGVAAHISGAAAGGPRYNPTLTAAQRSSIKNAIWLCQNCAKLIDNDEHGHPPSLLYRWKDTAEQTARRQVGKAQRSTTQVISAERLLKRDLKLRDDLKRLFLRPWEERQRSRRADGSERPFDKFRYSRVIIHRVGQDTYPEVDVSPGISSWFRLGTYDFYYNGITFSLDIESGVIEKRQGNAGNLA